VHDDVAAARPGVELVGGRQAGGGEQAREPLARPGVRTGDDGSGRAERQRPDGAGARLLRAG
jgi:hypothetical protein